MKLSNGAKARGPMSPRPISATRSRNLTSSVRQTAPHRGPPFRLSSPYRGVARSKPLRKQEFQSFVGFRRLSRRRVRLAGKAAGRVCSPAPSTACSSSGATGRCQESKQVGEWKEPVSVRVVAVGRDYPDLPTTLCLMRSISCSQLQIWFQVGMVGDTLSI
jgi:hypothetical protein